MRILKEYEVNYIPVCEPTIRKNVVVYAYSELDAINVIMEEVEAIVDGSAVVFYIKDVEDENDPY